MVFVADELERVTFAALNKAPTVRVVPTETEVPKEPVVPATRYLEIFKLPTSAFDVSALSIILIVP